MSDLSNFAAGAGAGLLVAALLIKLFAVSWLVVSLGVLLLVLAGTGALAGRR
jgi:hypothetical protein